MLLARVLDSEEVGVARRPLYGSLETSTFILVSAGLTSGSLSFGNVV